MRTYSTREVMEITGTTFRQLQYWVAKGWITGLVGQGSGHPLRWTEEQVEEARWLLARLETGRGLLRMPRRPGKPVPEDIEQISA